MFAHRDVFHKIQMNVTGLKGPRFGSGGKVDMNRPVLSSLNGLNSCDYMAQIQDPELDNMSAMPFSIPHSSISMNAAFKAALKNDRPAQFYRCTANARMVKDSSH